MLARYRARIVARSRFTEDRLEKGAFAQYVILGAGLDSFIWRRPDLVARLRVLEIDHPSTQTWKRARAAEAGLPNPRGHVYASVDFESQTLRAGLDDAGFDWKMPALFSWLGVTMYLTVDAIETTLKTIADSAPGSEIVFGYCPDRNTIDPLSGSIRDIHRGMVSSMGEPTTTTFMPEEIEALTGRCGLAVLANTTAENLRDLFFSGRTDDLWPDGIERFIVASRPQH
jgi:methyltransferase (TIGR00027 family)